MKCIPKAPIVAGDRVANLNEAATIIGCSPWTIKRRWKEGRISIIQISTRRLGIRLSEIQRYLTDNEAKAA